MHDDLKVPPTETDHTLGSSNALVHLVEYGDYECPDCLNSEPIVRQLRLEFGEKLSVVFRHFPQNSVHPHASAAAQAAEAAGAQHKFWEMHEALFKHQKEMADLDLTHLALKIGLDPYKFVSDTESAVFVKKVRRDQEGGVLSGVHRTPTFFINTTRHDGTNDLQNLRQKIVEAISQRD